MGFLILGVLRLQVGVEGGDDVPVYLGRGGLVSWF